MSRPLDGLLVLEFSQYMAGPGATLRLADPGARVIKIERPGTGDGARQLFCSNLSFEGDSTLFHTVNRGKESFAVDLKTPAGRLAVRKLVARADVLVENFRPDVMARLGMDYPAVSKLNPRLIYASVTGYGTEGPWTDKPGQDLLVQARSGLVWLSGTEFDPPTPFGLAVVDMFAAAHLTQGILACLVRRGVTGQGGRVEISLLESVIDLQFEGITTHLNDGGQLPNRGRSHGAHAYLAAPYGIYKTADGFLAISMTSIPHLGELVGSTELTQFVDRDSWFTQRDSIKPLLAKRLVSQPTQHWLDILEPVGVWCAEVLNWEQLLCHDAFKQLNAIQHIQRDGGECLITTRCPIRIDGEVLTNSQPGPRLGEHVAILQKSFVFIRQVSDSITCHAAKNCLEHP